MNAKSKKNIFVFSLYIVLIAVYIVLTRVLRMLDGIYFKNELPLQPLTAAFCFAVSTAVAVYLILKHEQTKKRSRKIYILLSFIPLCITALAFFFIPNKPAGLFDVIRVLLNDVTVAFANDLLFCAIGCYLLIHAAKCRIAGVIVIMLTIVLYDLIAEEPSFIPLWLSLSASVLLGFFEVELHLITESALYCAVYHFLFHIAFGFAKFNSKDETPMVGTALSYVLYITALLILSAEGVYFMCKMKNIKTKKRQ